MGVACFIHVFTLEQLFSAHSIYIYHKPSLINICLAGIVCFAFICSFRKKCSIHLHQFKALTIYFLIILYVLATGVISQNELVSKAFAQFFPYFIALVLTVYTLLRTNDVQGFSKGILYFGAPLIFFLSISPHFGVGGLRVPWAFDNYGNNLRLNYLELGYTAGILLISSSTSVIFKKTWLDFLVRLLLILLSLYVLIKTGARGQTVFAIVATVIVFLMKGKNIAGRIVILTMFGSLLSVLLIELLSDMWSGSERWSIEKITQDGVGRFEIAMYGLELWSQSIIGIVFGIGHLTIEKVTGSYPHIVVLEVLAEEGVLGFLLFLWFVLICFRKGFKLASKTRMSKNDSGALFVLVGIMIYCFMLSFKQGTILGNWPFFLFGSIVSVVSLPRYKFLEKNGSHT